MKASHSRYSESKLKTLGQPYKPWFIIGDNGGQVHLSRQSSGLSTIDMKGKSVLDIGCAEGLVSIQCHERGATIVHGIEKRGRAVEVAQSIVGFTGLSETMKFYQGDFRYPDKALTQTGMLPQYDIVLANAVIHKVRRSAYLMKRLMERCKSTLVIRLGDRRLRKDYFNYTDVVDYASKAGFKMEWEACGYPQGEPPYSMEGEAWMAVFQRVS